MGIGKALTNDLERAIKMGRVPILTAMSLSLRDMVEQRWLVTDPRTEDDTRNIVSIKKISKIEQRSCQPGVGVDDRQFAELTGILLFSGLPDGNGVLQPIASLTNQGGREDDSDVRWVATGSTDQKEEKIRRFGSKRPGDVNWRVRSPVMMASVTSVIDYLAFRCTRMPFLHSITLKWSERRWDPRQVPLDRDLYRPEGERSQMIIIPALWMDASMTQIDPNIWGPYMPIVENNYTEYVARQKDEIFEDAKSFATTYLDYNVILREGSPHSEIGRVYRGLDTQLNRSLRIPFDRNIKSAGNDVDTYDVSCFDPNTQGKDITQRHFNVLGVNDLLANNDIRLTSSFDCFDGISDAERLQNDGWYGGGVGTVSLSEDIPENLPPYAYRRDGTPMWGIRSLAIIQSFAVRRVNLDDGKYALKIWVKGTGRIEIVRNTRQRPKGQWFTGNRITSVEHFREAFETVVASEIRASDDGIPVWKEVWVSFNLVDHYKVSEPSPKHELYIVLSSTEGSFSEVLFDHFTLHEISYDHKVSILNTVARSKMAYTVRPELRHVDLEKAFQADEITGTTERSGSAFRFDGDNIACEVDSKPGYNAHSTGTTINAWLRVNAEDEATHRILARRGSFILFKKDGSHIPGYTLLMNYEKKLSFSMNGSTLFTSDSMLNHFLHPAVCSSSVLPRVNWSEPNQYENFKQAYNLSGKQPAESYTVVPATPTPYPVVVRVTTDLNDRKYTDIGYGKQILVFRDGGPDSDTYDFGGDTAYTYGLFQGQLPDGTVVSVGTNEYVLLSRYMEWHQNVAYTQIVPVQDLRRTGSGFIFSPPPTNGFLDPGILTEAMLRRYPLFISGVLQFNRWFNFDIAMDSVSAVISINGTQVSTVATPTFPSGENGDRLTIGTSNPDTITQGSPISVYSFKIFQRKNSRADTVALVGGEAGNFNQAQYDIFKEWLDFDFDRLLDFWQEDMTDLGLWTVWPPGPVSPAVSHGWVRASGPDPTVVRVDNDHNRNLIADWYDTPYIKELTDAQIVGYQDGLIFWDFGTTDQEAVHGFSDRYWDPVCKRYVSRFLSYYDWLMATITGELNDIVAITDDIPTMATAGSPLPDPSPFPSPKPPNSPYGTYGQRDNQLVMTGVKGWFGYQGLLGYRDSIDQVRREGVVFNYLQIEFHYRAPRAELESLLAPYAKSIDQLFFNEIDVNQSRSS